MANACLTMERSGRPLTSGHAAGGRPAADEQGVRSTLIETIRLARQGAWAEAEGVLHEALSAVAAAALPRVYIACVDLVPVLLAESHSRETPGPNSARPTWTAASLPRTRSFPGADPALNYTHAIITALRLRLTAPESRGVRQAS
jgi:hypothetical protein